MILAAARHGLGSTAALLGAILAEPNRIMREGPDLRAALSRRTRLPEPVRQGLDQILRLASIPPGGKEPEAAGLLTALAYPDRIARRQPDGSYRLTSGRKAVWPGPCPLAAEEFLAVAELDGDADNARIWQAAPLSWKEIETIFKERMRFEDEVRFDPALDRVVSRRKLMLDALCLREEPLPADAVALTRALLAGQKDPSRLPWDDQCRSLRDRVRFLRGLDEASWPDLSDVALMASLADWLGPFASGARSTADLARIPLLQALKHLIGWDKLKTLDRMAPEFLEVPSGARRRVDYSPESGPALPVKLQEMFGCADTPTLADGRHALVLHLLSPAGRPLQVTRDLPSFWKNGYPLVRAEMRGRYPKHPWPEDPTSAIPTAKTKKAVTPR